MQKRKQRTDARLDVTRPPRVAEVEELAAHRLARLWTWEELARRMARAGFAIPTRTLHAMVETAAPGAKPTALNRQRIAMYLKHVKAQQRRARRVRLLRQLRANGDALSTR